MPPPGVSAVGGDDDADVADPADELVEAAEHGRGLVDLLEGVGQRGCFGLRSSWCLETGVPQSWASSRASVEAGTCLAIALSWSATFGAPATSGATSSPTSASLSIRPPAATQAGSLAEERLVEGADAREPTSP